MRPSILLLSALAVALGGLVAAPAAPASAAACSGTSGVTVVVGSDVRCASGDPSTGAAALQGAGFAITQVARQQGFVCRIDNVPSPAEDACQVTPPASAYWSYWHAEPGGTWQYSNQGAYAYNPAPGSVEGWAYGAGDPPSPRAPVAPTPTTDAPPSTTPPAAGGGSGGSGSGSGGSAGSGSAASGSAGSTGATGGSSAGTPAAPGTTEAAPDPAAPSATDGTTPSESPSEEATTSSASPTPSRSTDAVALASSTRDAGGTPWGPIAGGVLVAVLAAAAAVVAWRRRTSEAGPGAYGG